MDPTLFNIYEQEKVNLVVFTIVKIAIWTMNHNPKDCGMLRSDFEMYLQVCGQFFLQLLKIVLEPLSRK
jgi:hypothetical protein